MLIEFSRDTKKQIQNTFNAILTGLCNQHKADPETPEANLLRRQKEIRKKLNKILFRVDEFLEDENIDLRSEEFLIFLFDDIYHTFKNQGIFNFNL